MAPTRHSRREVEQVKNAEQGASGRCFPPALHRPCTASRKAKRAVLNDRSRSAMTSYCVIPPAWLSGRHNDMKTMTKVVVVRGEHGGSVHMQKIYEAAKIFYMTLYWWEHVLAHCQNL